MDEFLSEKEQIAQIRQWWGENGMYIIAGLVVGIAGLVGWNQWQQYRETRAGEGSEAYTAMSEALENATAVTAFEVGARLISEYQDTPYADLAGFALAKYHVGQSEAELAAGYLSGVLENTRDEEIRHIARLRLARLQMEQAEHATALQTLAIPDPGRFAARYHELRGDAQFGLVDQAAARDEYRQALGLFEQGVVNTQLLQMKLDSLAEELSEESSEVSSEESSEESSEAPGEDP